MSMTPTKLAEIHHSFWVPCVPPTATSQQKGACIVGGKRIRFFKKKPVQQAENSLFALLMPHRPVSPHKGPLRLFVRFCYPWRKSEKKSILKQFKTAPIETRPDCSNLIKSVEDVMTTLGFWGDDGQIAHLEVAKEYADETGIFVAITSLYPAARSHEQPASTLDGGKQGELRSDVGAGRGPDL